MGRYLLRRLLQFVPVFLGTTFIVYTLVWAVPGDPFAGKCGERQCPDTFISLMTTRYGLDQPLIVQYFSYLGKVFTGNLGDTFSGVSISEQLLNSAPITVRLAIMAVLIQTVIGVLAGVLTGLR